MNNEQKKEAILSPLDNVTDSVRRYFKLKIAREAKEEFVRVHTEHEENYDKTEGYELPDGSSVTFGNERFDYPKIFFSKETNIEKGQISSYQSILEGINTCDIDLRQKMFQNILVVGGNTMIPGFTQNLEKQLYSNAPESTKVKIFSYPRGFERKFSSWLGGSILASTGTFQNMWISKFEYEESGASIVKRKCC